MIFSKQNILTKSCVLVFYVATYPTYVDIRKDYLQESIGTYVSSTFHSFRGMSCQPEMFVIWSEIIDTHFRLEIHGYCGRKQPSKRENI